MTKRTLGVTTIHTSISSFIHQAREPQTAVFLCNKEGEQTNLMHFNLLHRNSILVRLTCIRSAGWARYLRFAQRAKCIYLEPFINTILVETMRAWEFTKLIIVCILGKTDAANLVQEKTQVMTTNNLILWKKRWVQIETNGHTASSAESDRSFSVPAATIPPSWPSASLPEPWRRFLVLNLYVGKALIDSEVAPLVLFVSSLKPITDIMQGRQQHIIAQRMNGMAYPMQLKVRNTIHNLVWSKSQQQDKGGDISFMERTVCIYLYKFGASAAEERPPNIHTFPTTNHTAKKQSRAILKWSNSALILQMAQCIYH